MARHLASWLAFPVVMGGSVAAAIGLMPALGPAWAVVVVQTVAVVCIVIGERLLPHRATWNRPHGDVRTDVLHAIVSGLGTTQVARPLVQLAAAGIAAWLAAMLGGSLWPVRWPLAVQLGLALVVAELPQYWFHRLEHEHDALWRFHAVHHSAPRLYWLNAARFHPVDLLLLYVVGYLPLVALGCPAEVFFLFALFDAVFGMLQHCNLDVRLGPLNWLFSMAEPHRWHHSRVLAEANSNYGSNLILWDHVFGTFFLPRDREPPRDIGIADLPRFPGGYLAQLAVPFRWRAVRREAGSPHPAPPMRVAAAS
jgi:sterol desaturase/sphingolipid hydroxylase (fatty acid hydroxylase superfamily)